MNKLTLDEIEYAEEFLTAISQSSGWGDLKAIEILQKALDNSKNKPNVAAGKDFTYLANQLVKK